jgi:hypothetical protein
MDTPASRFACSLAVALAAASPAAAQGVVPPADFEALAEGRTLHFTLDGLPFGAERFFAGRRSLWRFLDGTCAPGRWYDEGGAICFVYEDTTAPICWHFTEDGGGYSARLLEDGVETGFVLDLAGIDDEDLACPGPEVGS